MKNEVVNPKDFGLEEEKANELKSGLVLIQEEKEALKQEFSRVSKLELTEENQPVFKELRLKIRDNRTKRLNKWKDSQKAYFLAGGNFVQAIYNKEVLENNAMEEKLISAEKHFENLEKERIEKLQAERVWQLKDFVEDAHERDLSSMENDVWESFLATKKQVHLDKIQAELDAEKQRQAELKAKQQEEERIIKENAKLKAEAEERERLAKIESDRLAKIESDRKKAEAKKEEARKLALKKEREAAELVLAKQKEASELLLKKEREAKKKLEDEIKAKKEAELKKEQERLAKEKELAKAPIKKQLDKWVDSFELSEINVDNDTKKEILDKFEAFKKWSKQQVKNL